MNETTADITPRRNERNRPLLFAGLSYIVLFGLFVLSKNLLPQDSTGRSIPPIYDGLFLLGSGICISIMGICYMYFSWTRNAEDYLTWYIDQAYKAPNWWIKMMSLSPSYVLWSFRIFAPIISLFGIALFGFGSYFVVESLLNL